MKNLQLINNSMKSPKVQVALSLAVATAGFLLPSQSESYNYCDIGSAGDCVWLTDGSQRCAVGDFWNDCQ